MVPTAEIALLYPKSTVSIYDAFQIEGMCTFVFVEICLLVKTGKTKPTKQGFLSCLAVSCTLLAMINIAADKTGAALNPAVGLAQTCFEVANFGIRPALKNYFWVYTVGPFTGGLVAGCLHRGQLYCFKLMNESEEVRKSMKLI